MNKAEILPAAGLLTAAAMTIHGLHNSIGIPVRGRDIPPDSGSSHGEKENVSNHDLTAGQGISYDRNGNPVYALEIISGAVLFQFSLFYGVVAVENRARGRITEEQEETLVLA